MKPFVIVLRAPSAVRLPHGRGVLLPGRFADRPAEVRVLTNWQDEGHPHPVPRELWFEVRLATDSINAAINDARVMSSMVAPVISFATNARIGQVEPQLAFEETVGGHGTIIRRILRGGRTGPSFSYKGSGPGRNFGPHEEPLRRAAEPISHNRARALPRCARQLLHRWRGAGRGTPIHGRGSAQGTCACTILCHNGAIRGGHHGW